MPIPRSWSGSIDQTDFTPALQALIPTGPGTITPDSLGQNVWNATGSTLTANTLVYISGWNVANAKFQVTKASASNQGTAAVYVVLADILNGAAGIVGKHLTSAASLNTNAATVGDAVYLNTTAGGFTLTAGPATGVIYQRVGRVKIKSATVGVIEFDLSSGGPPIVISRPNKHMPTIATTGATDTAFIIAIPGSVLGVKCAFKDALTANDTNYITFTLTNLTNSSTAMLAVDPLNTTQATGGQAIVTAFAGLVLVPHGTLANLLVSPGDIVRFTATPTGTLANTVSEGVVSLAIVPS